MDVNSTSILQWCTYSHLLAQLPLPVASKNGYNASPILDIATIGSSDYRAPSAGFLQYSFQYDCSRSGMLKNSVTAALSTVIFAGENRFDIFVVIRHDPESQASFNAMRVQMHLSHADLLLSFSISKYR